MDPINTTYFPLGVDPIGELSNCNISNTCEEGSFYGPRCCNWWALALLIFPVLTLFGNVLVILSVIRERNLQTATNYFIVSLAFADLLVAVIVMPFGVYYLFNNMWSLPPVTCDYYIAVDIICSTSSILNLVSISIDRFIAVTQPIKYAKHKKRGRVWTMISVAWIVSFMLGFPVVLGFNNTPDRVKDECFINNADYVIYSSLVSFFSPCIIMFYLYFKIFQAISCRAKKQRLAKKNAISLLKSGNPSVVIEPAEKSAYVHGERQTNTATGSNEEDDDFNSSSGRTELRFGAEESVAPRATRFMLSAVVEETGMIMANLASPVPITLPDQNTYLDSGYSPSNLDGVTKDRVTSPICTYPTLDEVTVEEETTEVKKKTASASSTTAESPAPEFKTPAGFKIFKVANVTNIRGKRFPKKERKATLTLAVVLSAFLICWCPFFICSVLEAICDKFTINCSPGVTVFYFTTWLGYMNSFINPIIYTIFNLEFRKAFRKILGLDK